MEFEKTEFKDLIICRPRVFQDNRGYFFESFRYSAFEKFAGFPTSMVQENQSRSAFGVLRGLHLQVGEYAQSKLVRVIEGKVLDVVVDLRREEPTFGKHFSIELSAENKTQLYVPRGMAHGFVTLSDYATFLYKCDNYYHAPSERGISYNDKQLAIDWLLDEDDLILSEKDVQNPQLNNLSKDCFF